MLSAEDVVLKFNTQLNEFINIVHQKPASQGTTVWLEGKEMHDKESALLELSKQMHLPLGMGHNYDSLEECLLPDFWPEAKTMNVVVKHADDFFAHTDDEVINTIFSILRDAAIIWQQIKQRPVFKVDLWSDA